MQNKCNSDVLVKNTSSESHSLNKRQYANLGFQSYSDNTVSIYCLTLSKMLVLNSKIGEILARNFVWL